MLAFAGETPHFAEAYNCSHVGCPRMILSFAGDNARYAGGRSTGLIPLSVAHIGW
jgi:hypothetical protein